MSIGEGVKEGEGKKNEGIMQRREGGPSTERKHNSKGSKKGFLYNWSWNVNKSKKCMVLEDYVGLEEVTYLSLDSLSS